MNPTVVNKALAIGLAWLPALFWLVFAAAGVILGTGGLFSEAPELGLLFIALSFAGVLGFFGLTWVCWTSKPVTTTTMIFLLCGVVSLLVAASFLVIEGGWNLGDPITLLQLTYFVICPTVFALINVRRYFLPSPT
ncbi:MAG: hypothetical protein AAGJ52_00850 [Pseudomonadota bacterium]